MTKEQKLEAYKMRLEGATLQSIADKFGCSKQNIAQMFENTLSGKEARTAGIVYHNIVKWMQEHEISVSQFCKLVCGHDSVSLVGFLKNERDIRLATAKKVLEVTGMTFEEAFSIKDDANG